MGRRVRLSHNTMGWCKTCGHSSNNLKFGYCANCRIEWVKAHKPKRKKRR